MWEDPIVKRVREAGKRIAEECHYDVHEMAVFLKKRQKKSSFRIVGKEDLISRKEVAAISNPE